MAALEPKTLNRSIANDGQHCWQERYYSLNKTAVKLIFSGHIDGKRAQLRIKISLAEPDLLLSFFSGLSATASGRCGLLRLDVLTLQLFQHGLGVGFEGMRVRSLVNKLL